VPPKGQANWIDPHEQMADWLLFQHWETRGAISRRGALWDEKQSPNIYDDYVAVSRRASQPRRIENERRCGTVFA
jgi:hypothetical protein